MTPEPDPSASRPPGESARLAELFETHADRLYRLACGVLRDGAEAEDVVQATFLAAMTHLDGFEGRSSAGTWLYRIAYNASIDRLRARRPFVDPPRDDDGEAVMPASFVEWNVTPDRALISAEQRAALEHAMEELPASLRATFLLRDVEEWSTAETAEALGISPGAVKVRLHRARLALRERLAGTFGRTGREARR